MGRSHLDRTHCRRRNRGAGCHRLRAWQRDRDRCSYPARRYFPACSSSRRRPPDTAPRSSRWCCKYRPTDNKIHFGNPWGSQQGSHQEDSQNGFCCPSGDTCNTSGCCGEQYPVACGDYCCTQGSTCGQGSCTDPCPAATPVACGNPLLCCAAGSACGQGGCVPSTGPPTLPPGNYNVTICVSGTIN